MGTPSSVIQPMAMQKVQNTAARLILRTPRHQNCTPLLQQLHWPPISYFAWKYIKTSLRYSKSNNDIQIQLRSKSNPTDQSINQPINQSKWTTPTPKPPPLRTPSQKPRRKWRSINVTKHRNEKREKERRKATNVITITTDQIIFRLRERMSTHYMAIA